MNDSTYHTPDFWVLLQSSLSINNFYFVFHISVYLDSINLEMINSAPFFFHLAKSSEGREWNLEMGLGVRRPEGFEPVPECMAEDTEGRVKQG